jgi:hypothetical protein
MVYVDGQDLASELPASAPASTGGFASPRPESTGAAKHDKAIELVLLVQLTLSGAPAS